jgi:hypothetical protein
MGKGSLSALLNAIANGPKSSDTTLERLVFLLVVTFPKILTLPSESKTWSENVRAELGKMAEEFWGTVEHDEIAIGMDAMALKALSTSLSVLLIIA